MNEPSRKPQAFRLGEPGKTSVREAARKAAARPKVTYAANDDPAGPAEAGYRIRITRRRFRWGALFLSSLAALLSLASGVALMQLIDQLFARSEVLGWIGAGLLALAGLAALAIIVREMVGLLRLKRLGTIHEDANRALVDRDEASARAVIKQLVAIFGNRPDVRWGIDQLAEHLNAVVAAEDLIRLAERDIMRQLDADATSLIARSARRVTVVTAVTPAAALDVLFVAALNLRMLRELAALYGGRPGTLGTLRLARMVLAHLAVTGGLALSDNLIQHVLGRGIVGKLSARFGEGAMNGIMTARIGLAALDLCRPLPFLTETKPSLALFMRELVSFDTADRREASDVNP
jgi:putative membrane protein